MAPMRLLKVLLLVALVVLSVQIYFANQVDENPSSEMVLRAEQGQADMSLRNANFPETYISGIDVDLTGPDFWVRLTWAGPSAALQERGPFHSSPGKGTGTNDCNDCQESNRGRSQCTPKGSRLVEGFSDYMGIGTRYKFVTWFHSSREIALHSHADVPDYPASHGCVRLDEHAAQLIHNNSIAGVTKVTVDGTWRRGPSAKVDSPPRYKTETGLPGVPGRGMKSEDSEHARTF